MDTSGRTVLGAGGGQEQAKQMFGKVGAGQSCIMGPPQVVLLPPVRLLPPLRVCVLLLLGLLLAENAGPPENCRQIRNEL